jgi:hypothetical protein
MRRSRPSRAGTTRAWVSADFRPFLAPARTVDLAFGVAFLDFALLFCLAARRDLVGRLAERLTLADFLAFLRVVFLVAGFRLAMADVPSNLDSVAISGVRSDAYRKSGSLTA